MGRVEREPVWPAGRFLIATPFGPSPRNGYVYRGLGISMLVAGSPKGRRPATWSLTHLGSGHCVCTICGDVRTAFPIATEIAEAGDWSFEGLEGYKNQFPDAAERMSEIMARHKQVARVGGASNADVARAIAMAAA